MPTQPALYLANFHGDVVVLGGRADADARQSGILSSCPPTSPQKQTRKIKKKGGDAGAGERGVNDGSQRKNQLIPGKMYQLGDFASTAVVMLLS